MPGRSIALGKKHTCLRCVGLSILSLLPRTSPRPLRHPAPPDRSATRNSGRIRGERDDFRCPIAGSGCTEESIRLGRNATLDLNGFDLRGAYGRTVIECSEARQGRCTVQGPGTLFASKGRAVRGNHQDIVLRDLRIYGPYDSSETTG